MPFFAQRRPGAEPRQGTGYRFDPINPSYVLLDVPVLKLTL